MLSAASRGFNPRPVRRLGATFNFTLPSGILAVSILAQSGDWARLQIRAVDASNPPFQSSPSPETGRDYGFSVVGGLVKSFNPRPVRRLGATPEIGTNAALSNVSILAQSGDWARLPIVTVCVQAWLFQSSPSPGTGRDSCTPTDTLTRKRFQSSPSPGTGRDAVIVV